MTTFQRIRSGLAAFATLALLAACADPGPPPGGVIPKFEIIDQQVGTGAEAKSGMDVTVHYTGWN